MKNFTKLFLLALCSGFLFLGFGNAQNLEENDPFTGEYDVSSTENGGFAGQFGGIDYVDSYHVDSGRYCTCDMLLIVIFKTILSGIGIILGMLLIILTVKAVILPKKIDGIEKDIYLSYIPVINLYSISKITIGRCRFFCIIILLGFFGYSIYENMHRDNSCCPDPSRQDYAGIIVGILTIAILFILSSKLTKLNKKDSNKESYDK